MEQITQIDYISMLEKVTSNFQAEIDRLNLKYSLRESEISRLDRCLKNANSELLDVEGMLIEAKEEIADLKSEIMDREEIGFDTLQKQDLLDRIYPIIDLYPNEVEKFIDTYSDKIFS